ncbi:unnamed protein product [Euphydryas editha]|uniref:FAM194 C-terminal domain-containing protein n=1 Tax=Euphydryas editha TaxID=104508 RepID=A0AAU9V0M7_EUPED|nr:unnamed protein product [Euphydryas editha]
MNQRATLRCCPKCTSFCDEEFKQVINLKKSGLLIYVYNKDSSQRRNFEEKRSIILCNSRHKEVKRFDYIAELCQYKTKCFKCKTLIQHIRGLIENLNTINKNEVLGICEYCKRLPKINKCKRCEYLINKFLNNETKQYLENKIRYNELISNFRQVLLSIMQGQIICKHNVYLGNESKIELQKLLKRLNSPTTLSQPNIDFLLDVLEKQKVQNNYLTTNHNLYDTIPEMPSKYLNDFTLEDKFSLLETRSSCICRYFVNNKEKDRSSFGKIQTDESLFNAKEEKRNEKNVAQKFNSSSENMSKLTPISITKTPLPQVSTKLKKTTNKKICSKDKYIKSNVVIKNKNEKNKLNVSKENESKQFFEPRIDSIVKLMKHGQKVKEKIKKYSQTKEIEERSKLLDLTIIENLKEQKEILPEISESIVECKGETLSGVSEIIKGKKILPRSRHNTVGHSFKRLPLLFHVEHNLELPKLCNNKSFSSYSDYNKEKSQVNKSGVVLYQLSNREFIDKGWTKLPTTKIMRRMNVYKMMPAYTEFDWFKNHKDQKALFYDSREKLAEIYEDGCGKWFYKNGCLALEYYSDPEIYLEKRCTIYSLENEKDLNRKKIVNILACFDYLGNGIVYDNDGNVRLKYNQSEGLVIDKKIGPPGRWKWHRLNEPPVLYSVVVDTFVKDKPYQNFIKSNENNIKESDTMANIELDNLQREQANKMLKEYNSFQIRIKVVKINEYFTLRIINQAKIYLQFRHEHICFKLNLGMWLKKKEIVDINVAEISEVSTPFDYKKEKLSKP